MPDIKVKLRWIFRCFGCGHEVRARSFGYESPCPKCGGPLERRGRIVILSERREVKEDADGAKKD